MIAPSALRDRRYSRAMLVIVGVGCVMWAVGRLPTPRAFLDDPEYGHQLSAALQILRGEQPFVDFRSTYGPLRFYASALGQVCSGRRIIGELGLDVAALAVAYAVLFRLLWLAAGAAGIALVLEGGALILMPRMHKYFVVLMPVLVLAAAWSYAEGPGRPARWRLALAIAVTGLFRSDFGVYAALAGAAVVVLQPADGWRMRLGHTVALGATVLAWAAPWLAWVAARGALGEYLLDSSVGAARHAIGMSLPFPSWRGGSLRDALPALAFGLSGVLPAAAVLVTALDRRRTTDVERRMLPPLVILAQGMLLQAAHRSDVPHLLQAVPISLVVVAWLAGRAVRRLRAGEGGAIGAGLGIGALAAWAAVMLALVAPMRPWPHLAPTALAGRVRAYARPRAEFVRAIGRAAPDDWLVPVVEYVQACVGPDERILALPAHASTYYLSDRRFGGGQIALQPGYFSTVADQRRMIARLETEPVAVVIDDTGFVLDGRRERTVAAFAPIVSRYLDANFVAVGRLGPATVRVPRARAMGSATADSRGVPCPTPLPSSVQRNVPAPEAG